MVDCSLDQSAVMDCGFEVLSGKMCGNYPPRREVTAVRGGL